MPSPASTASLISFLRAITLIPGLRPRPAALHRVGRSPARTCAGTFFEFPAHPSACLLAAAALLSTGAAAAQEYPSRPIRIIVPQSPGASTDITARLIAHRLNESWKQAVVVDNRPGAGGITGTETVARAAPDGYTLMVVASSFSINPALHSKLPYDAIR